MRVSLRWLRDYATLDAPAHSLARALAESGTEVGRVASEGDGLVVARVEALTPVPGSQNLQFADIDVGPVPPASLADLGIPTTPLRIVTGAKNLRSGALVPYAPPGTRPPGLEEPIAMKVIRGQRSPGMLCSAAELGVGEDAAGILILERGAPGQPLCEVLDFDTVMDLEVTTNRPDCLSHVGIARELAAVLGEPLIEPDASVPEEFRSATAADLRAQLRVEDTQGCIRFALRVVEGVSVGESPEWMRRRLQAIGLRPINAVVDVTNYVAHELGQPLHAFDLDKFVAAGGAEVADTVVRRARAGERLLGLDGVERTLAGDDIVVAAGATAASLAGVMGGAATAVDAGTRAVLLEAATWDGPTIRATSRRHDLRTDASTLFEKGLSDALPPTALDRSAALIAGFCGGHVLHGVVEARPRPQPDPAPITVTADFLSGLLGSPVDATEAATVLAHLGFAVEQDGSILAVVPPGFRRDVRIAEDVLEEVARMLGYARVPSTLPGRRHVVAALADPAPVEDPVRDLCVGAGFDEAITLSFTSRRAAAIVPGLGEGKRVIPLQNPLSEEWSVLRTSQLPGLCAALAGNVNAGVDSPALFEVGRVYWDGERVVPPEGATPDGADDALPPLPLEPLLLSLAVQTGGQDGVESARNLRHVQALFVRLARDLAGVAPSFEPAGAPGLQRGRAAALAAGGRRLGLFGELSAATLQALGIHGRVVVGELRLDEIAPRTPRVPHFAAPSKFPAITRDLAVIVPVERLARDGLDAILDAPDPLLESAVLYDEFRSESLGARKGWTFRLTFRAHDRTLRNDEADAAQTGVARRLQERLGAEWRT